MFKIIKIYLFINKNIDFTLRYLNILKDKYLNNADRFDIILKRKIYFKVGDK